MNIRHIYIAYLVFATGFVTGCNKYLDVTPKSSISEEEVFTSEVGFHQALAGTYSAMTTRSLYGDNLTMGFVSALAQNYTSTSTAAPFYNTAAYRYSTDEVINKISLVWLNSYNTISSANNILHFAEVNRAVLAGNSYALIKGEALGLRAYLHFELLRLFGKSYILGQNESAIPYRKTIDSYSQSFSTVQEVAESVLSDLSEAASLLKPVDPILSNTKNRQFKMNYYAVKALEARVRLFMGDKEGAHTAAKIVFDSEVFPFVNQAAVSAAVGSRDRLFKSELVFALRINDMAYAKNDYFSFLGTTSTRLTRTRANYQTLYETSTGNSTDIRYNNLLEDDGGAPFSTKFWQTYSGSTLDSTRLDKIMPMIRISEMLYILAETSPTLSEGLNYLNLVRQARAIPVLQPATSVLTDTYLINEITKEYQKEFYAEGQLFYHYKRLNSTTMQFFSGSFNTNNYTLTVPDDEKEFNPNY